MKKIYLLVLLGLIATGMSAVPKDPSIQEARRMSLDNNSAKHVTSKVKYKRIPEGLQRIKSAPNFNVAKKSIVKDFNVFNQKSLGKKSSKSPSKLTAGGSHIYGYLTYSNSEDFIMSQGYGLYELTEDGYILKWIDPIYNTTWALAQNGWYTNGTISGVFADIFGGYIYGYYSYSIDFETGELLDLQNYNIEEMDLMYYYPMLNSNDNKIYGFAYNFNEGGQMYWAVADATDPSNAEALTNVDDKVCYSFCYNSFDGYFYGINVNQEFVKIDLEGQQTVIAEMPFADSLETFTTGLVYSPEEGLYYWNAMFTDNTSALYTITQEGEITLVEDYYFDEEFTYFTTTDTEFNGYKPSRPILIGYDFVDGSFSGTVTFQLPETYLNNGNLPSSIEYAAQLDGTTYTTGTATPGSQVTIDYTVEESGFHKFALYVTVGEESSTPASIRIYVGNDTPSMPTNVKLTAKELTWDAVTTGVHNGYVETSAVSYIIYLNGEEIGETKATSFDMTSSIDESSPIELYTAEVIAVCNGLESDPGSSNSIIAGEAFDPPLFLAPTEAQFKLMTEVNLNELSMGWHWSQIDGFYGEEGKMIDFAYCEYSYGEDMPMDDYLFLPPVKISDPNKYYDFSLLSGIRSLYSVYPGEYLEVVYATSPSPEDVIGTVIPTFNVVSDPLNEPWQYNSGLLKVPQAGDYYIGIHCISDYDQIGIVIRNLNLELSNVTNESPEIPTDIIAMAGAEGALSASVSFVFPTKTMNGEDIPATTTLTAELTVEGVNEIFTTTGTPGSLGEATVTTLQGNNTIYIKVLNGDLEGAKASVKVYTGVSIPATPSDISASASADMMSAILNWEPVTTSSQEDGYIDPSNVTYAIYQYVDLIPGWGWYDWVEIENDITDTTYNFIVESGAEQSVYILGVAAVNEAGWNGEVISTQVFLGSPYEIPLNTVLTEEGATTQPWYIYSLLDGEECSGEWEYNYVGAWIDYDCNDIAFIGYPINVPSKGALGAPRFSTMGCGDAELSVSYINGPDAAPFKVYAEIYGVDQLIEIASVEGKSDTEPSMTTGIFELPEELLDQYWVQLYIVADYSEFTDTLFLTGFDVTSLTTEVLSLKAGNSIYGGKGFISLKGFEGKDVVITTLGGVKLENSKISSNDAIYNVQPGIYIVKAGERTAKVVVR